jgi:hypothetical protein
MNQVTNDAGQAGPDLHAELRWMTIDAADTPQHPGLVNDLLDRKIDGMTLTGVFDPSLIPAALDRILAAPGWSPQTFGAMLGRPLYQSGANSQDQTEHMDDAARCKAIYREAFGFDPHERLREVLEPMTAPLTVGAPSEGGRPYNPGNIRRYDPGFGGLKAHAGNEFIELIADGAVHHLLSTTQVIDHLSYFVVLQPAEVGGSLSVFDLLYDEHVHEDEKWAGTRDDAWFNTIPCLRLDPGPGDMILFGGGWRWHRVDEIAGTVPRITYGGFASPSLDGEQLHLFS